MIYKMWLYIYFLISFVTTYLSGGSYYCGTGSANQTVFECKQGSDCISKNNICDGTKDCTDGSDEESCYSYEAKSGTCELPPYPDHGNYEVFNVPKDQLKGPGQLFESFMLKLRCDPGYIVGPGYGVDVNGTWEVFCENSIWSQIMPQCIRKLLRSARMTDVNQKSLCKLDPDPSVHYMCSGKICSNSVPEGTIVKPICNYPVYIPVGRQRLGYMTCNAGVWDHIVRCEADCGRVSSIGVGLVIDGKPVMRGELPWHVGIYRKPKPYTQICGGSLVSNDVVISAAHCFWGAKQVQPASNYLVAVGKLYREWDDERDSDAQKSHVLKIMIPNLFDGAVANFQEDIAAVILGTSITYKTYVRPVCISYNDIFDRLQLQHGNLGKVAGWGLTGANGDFSPYLQVVQMPFINEATCIQSLPLTFRPYVTGDKFCAGYTNGTGVCRGDSGGGLVFSEYSQGLDRYYLRGIVSTAPTIDGQRCNDKTYSTFTKITKHQDFIEKYVPVGYKDLFESALAEVYVIKRCQPAQEEYCNQNPEFVEDLVVPINTSVEEVQGVTKLHGGCVLPPYPTNGTYQSLLNARPGQVVDSFTLTVSCRRGFGLVDPDSGNETNQQIYCINGKYQQSMPKCIRFCHLKSDPSVRYLCPAPNGEYETCRKYVAPGTLVKPLCNEPMYSSEVDLPNMKCNSSGFFDYVAQCKAECGRANFESIPSTDGANAARRGEVPWHVGIYQKRTTSYEQICGGSIITNSVVLFSAVCFMSTDMTKVYLASNYAVAAGKLYREWDSDRDADAQKSDVAGWGLTWTNGIASDFLQIRKLAICGDCLENAVSYQKFKDSFDINCAAVTRAVVVLRGKHICHGDNGGGLSFSDTRQDTERYYIRGVVSTDPIDKDRLCNDHSSFTLNRVLRHKDLIEEAITASTEETCAKSEFQCDDGSCVPQGADCNGVRECEDGSDEADELCEPEVHS